MTPTIAMLIWTAGLIVWSVVRIPYQRRARKFAIVASRERTRQQSLVAIAVVGLSVIPAICLTAEWHDADWTFSPVLAWIGVAAILLYLWFFYRSHHDLGRNWSPTLDIREKHTLVTKGIYRFIRHPMYVSFWLMAIAQACLLQSWIGGLAGLVGVGILYFFRVAKEEKMMLDTFGAAYRDYAKKTSRLIPGIY